MPPPNFSVEQLFSTSWDRRLAVDLLAELEAYTGEKRTAIEEMRRFLAVKGYRELLQRVQAAREGNGSYAALRSVARAMREYGLERPALSAAAFRTPTSDSAEWRAAHEELRDFMIGVLAECGMHDNAADHALAILRSLVRGFVLHDVMRSFSSAYSYDEGYDEAIDLFVAGLGTLI
jgi:hypothetical protein